MLTKNTTPFLLAAFASSVRSPAPSMTIVVRGSFRLAPGEPLAILDGLGEQGSLEGDVFAPGDDERTGPLLRAGDFAEHKPRVDVLVRADCHTPGGKPMTECPARVTLGAWSKALRVTGNRTWQTGLLGASPSAPSPFTRMPIDFTRAFGGPGHDANPAGKGLSGDDLPNTELPGEPLHRRADRPAPATFGPVSPFWPARKSRIGKDYGATWAKTRAPFWAADFDPLYFQAALPDQQLADVRGDEEMGFLNLHPSAPLFSVELPALRLRAFVRFTSGALVECPLRLDTVSADLPDSTLRLAWRGALDVAEDDLADVKTVFVASEPLASEPRALESYRAEVEAFEADPVGIAGKLPGDAPAPPPGADVEELFDAKLHGVPDEHRKTLGDSLRRLLARSPERANLREELRKALTAPPAPSLVPAIAVPAGPGASPRASLGPIFQRIRDSVSRLAAQAAAQGKTIPDLDRLTSLSRHPFFAALDPSGAKASAASPGASSPAEPAPGADLSGHDLSGRDLRGVDLSGANLEGANLQNANLESANLQNANLTSALLAGANLTRANLTGANLTQAHLAGVTAPGADLSRATLDFTVLDRADLSGATLESATGKMTLVTGVKLPGAKAAGLSLEQASFQDVDLSGARLEGARLHRSLFAKCDLRGADLSRADVTKTSFDGADLEGARLTELSGERAIFLDTNLTGADLSLAVLPDSHFSGSRAHRASLWGANLKNARFYRADLTRADLTGANLFQADLRKSILDLAIFQRASLFAASLHDTSRRGWNTDGANLTHAMFGRQDP